MLHSAIVKTQNKQKPVTTVKLVYLIAYKSDYIQCPWACWEQITVTTVRLGADYSDYGALGSIITVTTVRLCGPLAHQPHSLGRADVTPRR